VDDPAKGRVRLLDVAAGTGIFTRLMLRFPNVEVAAVEPVENMRKVGRVDILGTEGVALGDTLASRSRHSSISQPLGDAYSVKALAGVLALGPRDGADRGGDRDRHPLSRWLL
jgi:hypothetical protein